jgi:Fe-S-cluster-containing dehydrogenase component
MIHAAGGGGISNSGSNNINSNGIINGNHSSTIPSTVPSTTLSTSSSSSNTQSQDDDDLQSIHQHFRSKTVCKLNCAHCDNSVCVRGMKVGAHGVAREGEGIKMH